MIKTLFALGWYCVLAIAPIGVYADDATSGPPAAITPDGGRYWGPLVGGLRQGEGRVEWNNGASYSGGFVNGIFSGKGRLVSPAQEYTGEFRQGQFWGKGELRQKNGRTYKGEFVRGEFEGKGQYAIPNGPTYQGVFAEGKLQGQGLISYPHGAREEGKFLDWRLNGHGKYTDPDGTTFEGEFKDGQLVGAATVRRSDGDRYVGEIKDWMPHGQGELQLANGDVYRGGFSYGMYEGQGTLTYAKAQSDGRTQDAGAWEYGRLKKKIEDERRRNQANAERALYTQTDQLNRALHELQPSSGKAINLYLLAVAGDGTQEVFRREVDFVRNQFQAKFDTQGHAIALINSRNTVGSSPLATVTSIRQAVFAIAAKMDKERDILFVYLTSHGSKEGTIGLGLDGMRFPDLSANELAALMKESGIRWKVIVISACYAGSFMEPLRDPGTLLMAAARADRRSFGCSDDNDFTYFGRAFFKESLPSADSFEHAFSRAAHLIKQWEDRDSADRTAASTARKDKSESAEERHSLPQIDAPEPIRQHLKSWRSELLKKTARSSGS